ncbi:hypothetical protein MASR2M15_17120 [Anaerolineales bacterium]
MSYVLHLEDDPPLIEIFRLGLMATIPDVTLKQFKNGEEAITFIEENGKTIDLFVLDIRVIGDKTGIDVAKRIRELELNAPIIISSAFDNPSYTLLNELNAIWEPKPWHVQEIMLKIRQYLD